MRRIADSRTTDGHTYGAGAVWEAKAQYFATAPPPTTVSTVPLTLPRDRKNSCFKVLSMVMQQLLVKHTRYHWLLLAERHLNRRRSEAILQRIVMLPAPPG
jgi:hypothetical protein